jgi:hypothetical protein
MAALARRRAKAGSSSDSGTPEQLRWSESEVAELSVSLVFNPEYWSRDTNSTANVKIFSGRMVKSYMHGMLGEIPCSSVPSL